jgi:hypothetical protein
MKHGQTDKFNELIYPQSVATNATATGILDTLDANEVQLLVSLDTAATNPTVLKVGEGDTTSAFTDIGALTGDDTTNGFTIPAVDTTNGNLLAFNVDMRKRKRYLQLSCTPGVAQVVSATARLSRRGEELTGATAQGLDTIVNI